MYGLASAWLDGIQTDCTFPNCVEHSTCQIVSVIFLELVEGIWRFDFDAIQATLARPDLEDFFKNTKPSDLMNQSEVLNSRWSRVMAGLKEGDGIPKPIYVCRTPDGRLENEARAGLISQVKVFAALFRLPSAVSEEWTVEEVAGELERLLNLLNRKRRCTVTIIEWWQAEITRRAYPEPQKEFGGHFWIQVWNRETERVVGSILLRETETIGHSEILGIRTFAEGF
jgi:hypothetical protein